MIKVLFICLGNICRSPMAEGIFKALADENSLSDHFSVDSAGINPSYLNSQPDLRAVRSALTHKITLYHLSRRLTVADLESNDYLIVMDNENYKAVIDKCAGESIRKKVIKISSFTKNPIFRYGIKDPYSGTQHDFDEIYDILEECCSGLLEKIAKEHKLIPEA